MRFKKSSTVLVVLGKDEGIGINFYDAGYFLIYEQFYILYETKCIGILFYFILFLHILSKRIVFRFWTNFFF